MSSLLIIGSGGHGKSVLDCALSTNRYDEVVFASNEERPVPVPGFKILDERELSYSYIRGHFNAVIVAIGDNAVRLRKTERLLAEGIPMPPLVHDAAYVSPLARLGAGTVVLASAVVNAFASVGMACVVNSSAVVEHDCVLENGVHLSPGAIIAGGCVIGRETWICSASGVADHVSMAPLCTLAGGSYLRSDGLVSGLYAGVPATLKRDGA